MTDFVLQINPKMLVKEERIDWAAIKVFAQYPFSLTTVKMIADEAELPLSAVMYHHKSKESLYETVLNRLVPHHNLSRDHFRRFLGSPEKSEPKWLNDFRLSFRLSK